MSLRRTSPRPLAIALDPLRSTWAPATLLAEVQDVWPDVVGAAIAAEARPDRERSGILTISCSASVWAHELDLMAPQILERLNRRLDRGRVTRLKCVATP